MNFPTYTFLQTRIIGGHQEWQIGSVTTPTTQSPNCVDSQIKTQFTLENWLPVSSQESLQVILTLFLESENEALRILRRTVLLPFVKVAPTLVSMCTLIGQCLMPPVSAGDFAMIEKRLSHLENLFTVLLIFIELRKEWLYDQNCINGFMKLEH